MFGDLFCCFVVFFWGGGGNVDHLLTQKRGKGGPLIHPTAYVCMYVCMYICMYVCMCIYIYMHAVKLSTGPSLGVFGVINWAKSKLLTGPRSFSHYKIGVSGDFLFSYHCVFFWRPVIWQFSKNSLFQKKGAKIGFFNFLCFNLKF